MIERSATAATALDRLALTAAPLVALAGGVAAEWLDFRALRAPLLLMVGIGVLATARQLPSRSDGRRRWLPPILLGVATWAAVQSVYAVIHTLRGEHFDAARFGPQWTQALALIAAHALLLGAPTGAVVAVVLRVVSVRVSRVSSVERRSTEDHPSSRL